MITLTGWPFVVLHATLGFVCLVWAVDDSSPYWQRLIAWPLAVLNILMALVEAARLLNGL